jgi:hypothetical protein
MILVKTKLRSNADFLVIQGVLQFGMVIENAEFVSDESSDSEEEEQVKMGTVRVAWYPAGTEEVSRIMQGFLRNFFRPSPPSPENDIFRPE